MTTLADLPGDLVENIFSRVPITSLGAVRSTSKKWEALSKSHILGKAAASARKQYMGFMMMDSRVCSLRFDLQGIRNDGGDDLVDPSIKQVSKLDQMEISHVFYCDGLLLCVVNDNDSIRLMVWNMYLGKKRFIRANGMFNRFKNSDVYALGYDSNNGNHKILRDKSAGGYEIYSLNSDSWKVLDVTLEGDIHFDERGVSLKGNAYLLAQEDFPERFEGDEEDEVEAVDSIETRVILLCFDFTTEKFGQSLPLPFYSEADAGDYVTLSCVRDEQLAVLYQHYNTIEIWISTQVQPNAVSWSMFLNVDLMTLDGLPADFTAGSFFIDEEKQVAVVFDQKTGCNQAKAYIIGEDGYFKSVNVGDAPPRFRLPLVCTSYVPSLVPLKINKPGKRKERDY